MEKLTEIRVNVPEYDIDENLYILKDRYTLNDATAILLFDKEGFRYMDVTVNIEGLSLEENEVAVKTWSENAVFVETLLGSGYFRDTGKVVPTGYVQAQVWEVLKPIANMGLLKETLGHVNGM